MRWQVRRSLAIGVGSALASGMLVVGNGAVAADSAMPTALRAPSQVVQQVRELDDRPDGGMDTSGVVITDTGDTMPTDVQTDNTDS